MMSQMVTMVVCRREFLDNLANPLQVIFLYHITINLDEDSAMLCLPNVNISMYLSFFKFFLAPIILPFDQSWAQNRRGKRRGREDGSEDEGEGGEKLL